MPTSFRIFKTKHTGSWADGEGAFRFGGRWNSRGARLLYTAESLSLAALEMLVNLNADELLEKYSFAAVEFKENYILPVEEFRDLPNNWNVYPAPIAIQQIGDEWVRSMRSLVLKVPTAVVPNEFNYLINVEHKDFVKIKLGKPQKFGFDERLK